LARFVGFLPDLLVQIDRQRRFADLAKPGRSR
jgi:hypothetical protein